MSTILDPVSLIIEPRYLFLATASVVAWLALVAWSSSESVKSVYPYVGNEKGFFPFKSIRRRFVWLREGPSLIDSAFKTHHDNIITLPAVDRTSILLPPRFLEEIKELPKSIASTSPATSDFLMGKYTTLDYEFFGHTVIDAVKMQYITKIGSQVEPAMDEVTYAMKHQFVALPDWTPVAAQPKILQLVAQVVARTVIGPELCRDPRWSSSVIDFAHDVFTGIVILRLLPTVTQRLATYLLPIFYRIYNGRRVIKQLATPAIEEALAWKRDNPESWKAHLKSDQPTAVDWIVEHSSPEEATVPMIAHRLLGVSLGATHTTTNAVTNAIMDMANDFHRWAPPLREEISSVLGDDTSKITNAQLSKMWKLDSFLKESQRFHPPSKLSVNRKLLEPYTLSSGDVLPKGAHISFAGVPMSLSEEYFEKAEEFDSFRFERLRRNPETSHSGLQFTSSYAGTLHFGYGRQACPGRFMGSLISKLVLIELLQWYDMKLSEGGRPDNIRVFDMDAPDPTYKVLFRDRAPAA